MPNAASAKKELRKSIKRRQRNNKIENNLKNLIKTSRRAIENKEASAKELIAKTLKALDKAAKQGVIKKNTRDRKKSRLHKKFNQAFK
jgi:small subunit ribosomal protein S20